MKKLLVNIWAMTITRNLKLAEDNAEPIEKQ